jgi:hypothetical protein
MICKHMLDLMNLAIYPISLSLSPAAMLTHDGASSNSFNLKSEKKLLNRLVIALKAIMQMLVRLAEFSDILAQFL